FQSFPRGVRMEFEIYDTAPETLPTEAIRARSVATIHQRFGNADLASWNIANLGLVRGERVIDIGCGVGHITIQLARAVAPQGHAKGVDNEEDYAAAWDALDKSDLPVSFDLWRWGVRWPWPNGSFDAAVANLTFSILPNLDLAVEEVVRILRPGGRALITGSAPDDQADFMHMHTELVGEHPTAEMAARGRDTSTEVLPLLDALVGPGKRVNFANDLTFKRPGDVVEFYATGKLYGLLGTDWKTRDDLLDLIYHAAEAHILKNGTFIVKRRLVGGLYIKEP
ncbi:methyltransferase domain-containing protein, partial [bacterium]|nr:methyltransferase domain-containing protein [bacterium]